MTVSQYVKRFNEGYISFLQRIDRQSPKSKILHIVADNSLRTRLLLRCIDILAIANLYYEDYELFVLDSANEPQSPASVFPEFPKVPGKCCPDASGILETWELVLEEMERTLAERFA